MRSDKHHTNLLSLIGLGMIVIVLNLAMPFSLLTDLEINCELTELSEENSESEVEKDSEEQALHDIERLVFVNHLNAHSLQLKNTVFKQAYSKTILTPPPEFVS